MKKTTRPKANHTEIMLVSNSTWNIHNFRMPVIQALLKAGYTVIIVAPVDETLSLLSRVQGVRIVPLRQLDRDGTSIWQNMRLFMEFLRLYRQYRPALIIHFTIKPNIFGNLAAAFRRIPAFCVVTGLGYTFIHRGWIQTMVATLYRLSFRFARQVIFENEYDRQLMLDQGIVRAERSISLKGCGVDLEYFKEKRKKTELPGQKINPTIVFTFIGRLLFDKGVREFVEAAKIVRQTFPNACFWILGGLDEHNPSRVDQAQLLEWVESGAVEYKGVTTDVRPIIDASNWIVLPSYREGLSRVLLEAMSMGRPLVTTNTPGCRETVEVGRNGFLVPIKNTTQLAATLLQCCAMPPEQAVQMGQYGREKAKREFASNLIGDAYLQLVQREL